MVLCTATGNGGLLDVAPVVPPDVFLNLRFSKEKSQDQQEVTESNTHIVSLILIHLYSLLD